MSASHSSESRDYRVKGGFLASAWKIFAAVAVAGLGGAFALGAGDSKRFAFAYLFGFATFFAIALGGVFFVIVQHLVSAGWSVTVRRGAEFMMLGLPAVVLLFLPVLLTKTSELYPWVDIVGSHAPAHGEHAAPAHGEHAAPAHGEHGSAEHGGGHAEHHAPWVPGQRMTHGQIEHHEHQELIAGKSWYLSMPFFLARLAIYLVAWAWLVRTFFKNSVDQDATKSIAFSQKSARLAPISVSIFALTLTFAAFDWFMALQPEWPSTIFGVWFFSSSVVSSFAALVLISAIFRASGVVGEAINTEHFHDLGKLLFGFNCFWAYISFSQFFLIWYASIPEETVFYHIRWGEGPWTPVSLSIIFLHFFAPFLLLISRNTKRFFGQKLLYLGAALVLVMHTVEMYWLVLPNYASQMGVSAGDPHALSISIVDVLSFLGFGGAFLAAVFFGASKYPLIPVGDPRLHRALHLENG
ncbi:MAG: hypothetical protein R3A48_28095 [Polyangiales bacterium]